MSDGVVMPPARQLDRLGKVDRVSAQLVRCDSGRLRPLDQIRRHSDQQLRPRNQLVVCRVHRITIFAEDRAMAPWSD
jgi:hypothetical protein